MDQPLVTGGSKTVIAGGRSPASNRGSCSETLKTAPQAGKVSPGGSNDDAVDIDANGGSVVNTVTGREAKTTETSADVDFSRVLGRDPPGSSASDSAQDGKPPARDVPGSNKSPEALKQDSKTIPIQDVGKTGKRPLDRNSAKEDVKNKKPIKWFEVAFDRVLNVAESEPAGDDLDATVNRLLRQEEENEDNASELSTGEKKKRKKKIKKSTGKRKSKSSQENSDDEHRRKTVRTLDVEELLDGNDLSEAIMNGSNDAEEGKPHAVGAKQPPTLKKGNIASSSEVHGDDSVVDKKSGANEKKIAEANNAPSISLLEFLEKARREIRTAASMVSRSLLFGLWPSPYRSLEPARIFSRNPSEYGAHHEHMSMVGVAIETFANDIISPAIVEEMQHCPEEGRSEPRAYLATLLYLREILVLNAATVFGPSAFLTGLEPDFTVVRRTQNHSMPVQDAAMLSVKMLATAVIIDGLHQLGVESEQEAVTEELIEEFLDMCEKYEVGDSEFSGCLSRITDEVVPFNPNRQKLAEKERQVWKANSNYLRNHHPLVSPTQTQVNPSAVHFVMVPLAGKSAAGRKEE